MQESRPNVTGVINYTKYHSGQASTSEGKKDKIAARGGAAAPPRPPAAPPALQSRAEKGSQW